MFLEVTSITTSNSFYSISGMVYGEDTVVYYLKTYSEGSVNEERIKREGKSTLVGESGSFSVSIRDQGVFGLFFVAESSLTRCHSPIIQIPVSQAGFSSPLHLWSPHLLFENNSCLLSCDLSEPSELFFLVEKRGASVSHSSAEVVNLGFYAGSFADKARFFIGSLSNSGEYDSWLVMKKGSEISDVYPFHFTIPCSLLLLLSPPACVLPASVELLSTASPQPGALSLSLIVHSLSYPLTLSLLIEPHSNHGNRPSVAQVLQQGQNFTVSSEDSFFIEVATRPPTHAQTQTAHTGSLLFWVLLHTPGPLCLSNLFRFVFSPPLAGDRHPVALSAPLVTALGEQKGEEEAVELYALHFQGVFGFPEKVSESHQPFCEVYYSFSPDVPVAISQRQSVASRQFRDDYMYSFSLTLNDVLMLRDSQVVHIVAEESLVNQNHVIMTREEVMECAAFLLTMQIQDVDKKLHRVCEAGLAEA